MALKASNLATEDIIGSMPDDVITRILDRLPVQDAVKMSILSRNWRHKWTMLSQLVFDDHFFEYLEKNKLLKKFGRIISGILLGLNGSITKFVLYLEEQCYSVLDDGDIARWILFLSKKGVRDLTIWKMFGEPFNLPTYLFSCLELRHLKLLYCRFDPPAGFHDGLPNLLSLDLSLVELERSKFGEFITRCPLLEILSVHSGRHVLEILDPFSLSVGKMKLTEIAKLAKLKRLSLSLCDTAMIVNSSSIFELVGLFPNLQELNLEFVRCKFIEDGAEKRYRTIFPYLKTLELSTLDVSDGVLLSCALELIRCCPNLQTLKISANDLAYDRTRANFSLDVDYTRTEPLQLRSVDVSDFKDSVIEVSLIQYLLECSPFLKRFVVHPHSHLSSEEKLRFASKLSELRPASLIAKVSLD